MSTRQAVVRLLADGEFHSGTDLGSKLGVSRAAIGKAVHAVIEAGLEVHSVTGRGYQLARRLEPLDRRRLLKFLGPGAARVRDRLTLLDEIDSTNRYLLEESGVRVPTFHGSVCLAEAQARGRGRRGRHWITTPYHNLMLSIGWRFDAGPAGLSGLTLAAGVAVLRALKDYGVSGVMLKWPNDILWEGRKLAGLLADLQGEASGPSHVVLGLGVNGYLAPREAARIDQPWADLATITGRNVERNRLAALIVGELFAAFDKFAAQGFAAFRDEWQRCHAHQGKPVRLSLDEKTYSGVVEGVDEHGALLLRDGTGKARVFHSGDVSLRGAA
jgi:BirA family biotin operon repressor/biotin-[acetyl-CoA-carboxylase] ligase